MNLYGNDMTTQPEQLLENNLVTQLRGLGYQYVEIKDEADLMANFQDQLEKHNKTKFTQNEFFQILNQLGKGNIFEKAKTLREKIPVTNDKGQVRHIELINKTHWCQNLFQVTQQVTMEGSFKNRYDVTILINGLPLVQIELKRRGLELKEAFNQTNRYERHSYGSGAGLFQFIQIFVISNGVNTKYYCNNPIKMRSFKQTFYWSNKDNQLITQLKDFTDNFLEPCHLAKMVTKYTVLNETQQLLMILRPYQFYAVEAIVDRVKTTTKNGYIWHTTGSGKTLTSFKAAQIITGLEKGLKVVFVVDRKDLDYQTTREFDSFSKGSVDATNDTQSLVKQLTDETSLIVTTIQKLNTAISKAHFSQLMTKIQHEKIVFIFDECHRSQFGETHSRIKGYFTNAQMFGFTGTPIFAENAASNEKGKRTTKDLFDECLHKYVITDAIRDENVLKFSVEYISTIRQKDQILDINVEDIDRDEVMNAPERLEKIVDYILTHHPSKTQDRHFTSMFCVSSIDTLVKYYELFKKKQQHSEKKLVIGTIYSYQANEDDKDVGTYYLEYTDIIGEETTTNVHSRDKLEEFIADYNKQFGSNYSTKDSKLFYQYYNDLAKRVKNREIDILLVVNMFLTGFDSKPLNTLYVDKNLKYHGLIQAFSRTNRILDERKSQGNIVCFRNLKNRTDEAITLFSNKDAIEEIILQPYGYYVLKFNAIVNEVQRIAPTVDDVTRLPSETEEFQFVSTFRELMRVKNVLSSFTDFNFSDLSWEEQHFEDYKSKYLDIYDKVKKNKSVAPTSILNDIDFELELIHKDEINVAYILQLLGRINQMKGDEVEKEKQIKSLVDILSGESRLRSKRKLIEQFIRQNLPLIQDSESISEEFESYWEDQKHKAIIELSEEEKLDAKGLEKIIGDYLFTEKPPLTDDILNVLSYRPGLKDKKVVAKRITDKIIDFVDTFVSGMEYAA
jgi:type I restriction enzyme R subunit